MNSEIASDKNYVGLKNFVICVVCIASEKEAVNLYTVLYKMSNSNFFPASLCTRQYFTNFGTQVSGFLNTGVPSPGSHIGFGFY